MLHVLLFVAELIINNSQCLQSNFINMNTQYVSPKLLLEFYKGQKVPPLAVRYQIPPSPSQSITEQRKNQYNHFAQPWKSKNQSEDHQSPDQGSRDVQYELQKQIDQNRELRLIIKELQQKLERLKQVNDELIVRVEELEKRNNSLNESSETIKKDVHRKARVEVYKQVQDYLIAAVEKFTQIMHNQKITPQCENKIQLFLEQILNINNLSVRKTLNSTTEIKRNLFDEEKTDRTINGIIKGHTAEKSRQKRQLERTKYEVLLEKLNRTSQDPRPGQIVFRNLNSPSKVKTDTKSKRPKIFSNSKRSGQKSQSPEHKKRLDF